MATLSRRTLGIAMQCLERQTRTWIEAFLYRLEVPDELVSGSNKMELLLGVFRALERLGRHDLLRQIVYETAMSFSDDRGPWLCEALLRDGFALGSAGLAPDVPQADDNRTALEVLVHQHAADLDETTLCHHLRESIDLFRQEKWDSSVSHARNFVEQLLGDIAKAIAAKKHDSPSLSKAVLVRQYLQASGFFDKAEREKLVDGVYGYFSEEGSHPGISTQSAARVCMHVLWAFGFYVLEKFGNWKNDNPWPAGTTRGPEQAAGGDH